MQRYLDVVDRNTVRLWYFRREYPVIYTDLPRSWRLFGIPGWMTATGQNILVCIMCGRIDCELRSHYAW